MSVLDNNTVGNLPNNLAIGDFLSDNQINLVATFDGWCYPYINGGIRASTTFQGSGAVSYVLVNGNNIFSQVCMLLGLGACAYRLESGIALNVQHADVETINIVDGEPVERQHQAPIIHRFRPKKTDV